MISFRRRVRNLKSYTKLEFSSAFGGKVELLNVKVCSCRSQGDYKRPATFRIDRVTRIRAFLSCKINVRVMMPAHRKRLSTYYILKIKNS